MPPKMLMCLVLLQIAAKVSGAFSEDPRVYLPEMDYVGDSQSQAFWYQIKYETSTICETTYRSAFANAVTNTRVDWDSQIYFLSFGLNVNNV